MIVQQGGLPVLQKIYNSRQNNTKVMRNVARILANLTLCDHLYTDIVQGG